MILFCLTNHRLQGKETHTNAQKCSLLLQDTQEREYCKLTKYSQDHQIYWICN